VSLKNDISERGPYIVNITVINTPPIFKDKAELSVLREVSVRLKEKEVMYLPDNYTLENQPLTLSISDNKTANTFPFITVSMPDLSFLTFEPTNIDYVGDHMVRLVLSDDLGASTAYLLKMKILPLINKGAPIFNPVPLELSFRVALGEKFSKKFDYPTNDPDPEDTEILQSF
jgi:hypothetical protein